MPRLAHDVEERPSVAVVGSGIAGLTAAYALSKEGFDVTIFEREARLGVDSTSIEVTTNGVRCRVDTPPRAISASFYPNLIALYRDAGIDLQPWSWAWSYMVHGSARPFLRISGGTSARLPADGAELGGSVGGRDGGTGASAGAAQRRGLSFESLPEVNDVWAFLQLLRPRTLIMLIDAVRFHWYLRSDLAKECDGLTLAQYLDARGIGADFAQRLLLPILSMVCTCSYAAVLAYPVRVLRAYLTSLSSHNQFRAAHGTDHTARLLARKVRRCELRCTVRRIVAGSDFSGAEEDDSDLPGVVFVPAGARSEVTRRFDHVVLATPADVSADLVRCSRPSLAAVLDCFEYETSEVLLHRDPCVMPPRRADWSVASVVIAPDLSRAMFTLHTNRPECLAVQPGESGDSLFMTWAPLPHIAARLTKTKSALATGTAAEGAAATGRNVAAAAPGASPSSSMLIAVPSTGSADESEGDVDSSDSGSGAVPTPSAAEATTPTDLPGDGAVASAAATGARIGHKEAGARRPACDGTGAADSPVRSVRFRRSVVTPDTRAAVSALWALEQGSGGVWIAGAFTVDSIPLQESASLSGVRVARLCGAACSWAAPAADVHPAAASDVDPVPPPPRAAGALPSAARMAAAAAALVALAAAARGSAAVPRSMSTTLSRLLLPSSIPPDLRLPAPLLSAAAIALTAGAGGEGTARIAVYFGIVAACALYAIGRFPWRHALRASPATTMLLPAACAVMLCATWSRILFWFVEHRAAFDEANALSWWDRHVLGRRAAPWVEAPNTFLEAYAQVVEPCVRWWWASQLLNWVTVATAWAFADWPRARVAPGSQLAYIVGGFVTAISVAFPLGFAHAAASRARLTPGEELATVEGSGSPGGAARVRVLRGLLLACLALASAAGIALPAALRAGRPQFAACLGVLHAILAVPFVARPLLVKSPASGHVPRVLRPWPQAALFFALALVCLASHASNTLKVLAEIQTAADGAGLSRLPAAVVEAFGSGLCIQSISTDAVGAAISGAFAVAVHKGAVFGFQCAFISLFDHSN